MKYIPISIGVIITTFLILFFSYETPIDPFENQLDLSIQTSTLIAFDSELIGQFQDSIQLYPSIHTIESQSTRLTDPLTQSYFTLSQNDVTSNSQPKTMFQSISLQTKGFENFVDTQGITGIIEASFNTYRTDVNTYVETSIGLKNPPFNLNVSEKQYMNNPNANNTLVGFIDINALLIDPITVFKSLTLDETNTTLYELPFGHKLVINYSNILFTNTNATIEIIIYDSYLIQFLITLEGSDITIPSNILNGITLPEILDITITYAYNLAYEVTDQIPYSQDDLDIFERVDAFTLPDISSILNFLN